MPVKVQANVRWQHDCHLARQSHQLGNVFCLHSGFFVRNEIDSLMAKYVGQEHTMYLKICIVDGKVQRFAVSLLFEYVESIF